MAEIDFDPTTEEGQVDINDEEYESLIPDDSVEPPGFLEKIRAKFGGRARSAYSSLRRIWQRRNPGKNVPEYLQMEPITTEVPPYERPITEEEYEYLTSDKDKVKERLEEMYGEWWRSGLHNLREEWQRRNPGKPVEPFLDMNLMASQRAELGVGGVADVIRERFPNVDLARLEYRIGKGGRIQLRHQGGKKYYDLFMRRSGIVNRQLPKGVKEALGEPATLRELDAVRQDLTIADEVRAQKDAEIQKLKAQKEVVEESMKEMEKEYAEQNELVVKAQNDMRDHHREEVSQLVNKLNGLRESLVATRKAHDALSQTERRRIQELLESRAMTAEAKKYERTLLERLRAQEEQLRQKDQTIEDLQAQARAQQEIANDPSRSEEEREAARVEEARLREEVAESNRQRDNVEREMGLTTKEKIKRALLKYGLPATIATAVASAVGVLISMLKGTGNAVKKIGAGLKALGGKMAAAIPGLLGAVLSLILKTGGELLKFIGNNIWILVVALGMLFLKKMKAI